MTKESRDYHFRYPCMQDLKYEPLKYKEHEGRQVAPNHSFTLPLDQIAQPSETIENLEKWFNTSYYEN